MTNPAPNAIRAYHVVHTTIYDYSEPVSGSLHDAVLVIRETPKQAVRYSAMTVEPKPPRLVTRIDHFGNHLTRFSIETPSQTLRVASESEVIVHVDPAPGLSDSPAPADLRRHVHEARTPAALSALEFLFDSPYVPRTDRLADYAATAFDPAAGFLTGVAALMHRIHDECSYDSTVTEVSTPVEEVLARKKGVCQDFAHLMIGCLRSLDIPARYVSGYLVPLPGIVGAQASHAWVSVFSPNTGWVDFDPTNDVMPAGGHITVAWGRDYGDVSPIRGVIMGGGEHTLHVAVSVEAVNG